MLMDEKGLDIFKAEEKKHAGKVENICMCDQVKGNQRGGDGGCESRTCTQTPAYTCINTSLRDRHF